jgi:1,4-dihydroxy-2-naphthoyl-CoA hydrolase
LASEEPRTPEGPRTSEREAAQASSLADAAAMPLAALLGIQATKAGADEVRGRLPFREQLCTGNGVMHGGALMALADSMGALCAVFNLPAGARTSTIESKTNFFRAVRGGHVEAVSRPLHVGRSTIVVQSDLYDAEGRRVAQVTQTQAVLIPKEPG